MLYKSLKQFSSPKFGNANIGNILNLDEVVGEQMVDAGMVEPYQESKPEITATQDANFETKPHKVRAKK